MFETWTEIYIQNIHIRTNKQTNKKPWALHSRFASNKVDAIWLITTDNNHNLSSDTEFDTLDSLPFIRRFLSAVAGGCGFMLCICTNLRLKNITNLPSCRKFGMAKFHSANLIIWLRLCIFFGARSYVFFDCLVWNRRQHFNQCTRFSVYMSFWFKSSLIYRNDSMFSSILCNM